MSNERIGITIKPYIGIGDALQFSSLPENYFMATGKRLIDVSRPWFFDFNPYVDRVSKPTSTIELWNWPKTWEWPKPRGHVYTCNAEIWASLLNVPVTLNRPRLYRFENQPYELRSTILFHTHGRSHGSLPDVVIKHVINKYKNTKRLLHIGLDTDPDLGIPKVETKTLWDLAEIISKASMFIGIDSGPSWIAACYPDVFIKKIRNKEVHGEKPFKQWIPLEISNIHSHWDDQSLFRIHSTWEDDCNFLSSYKKI
jgi:hypothetical protein